MSPAEPRPTAWLLPLTALAGGLVALGNWTAFSLRAVAGLPLALLNPRVFVPIAFDVGVQSVGVVAITGLFIGMVLAVQAYGEFHALGLDTIMGSIVNLSVLRELGPVLAATMLAGRVGSAMAAELGTMRVTEQIDAIACLGVDPVHHLVSPRLLACMLLIPLLTALANLAGVYGGAMVCIQIYDINPQHYWQHSDEHTGMWDVGTGLLKSVVFGAVLALVSCHRGFHSQPGAAGVGRAATEAFVVSFVIILAIDVLLAMSLNTLQELLWPGSQGGGL
jgi:phospholipid/cholesterol/gamma-HCH transport system permease protein